MTVAGELLSSSIDGTRLMQGLANVKQALTILCAVGIFHLTITPANALGIVVTLAGGAWYAWVEYAAKHHAGHA